MQAVLDKQVTAQQLYEQHIVAVADSGVQLASWDSLPQWERDQWEQRAAELTKV
jgi:hypothetical protein